MNVLFILGNGFDINLGLKTRYQDFYDFYSKSHNDNDAVLRLKKHIGKNTDGYWSDLELALGKYTSEFKCIDDFDEVVDDIKASLSLYLKNVETDFNNFNVDIKSFLHDLSSFEEHLIPTDQDKALEFKEKFKDRNWHTEIVTFNYTNTVEKLNYDLESDLIGHQYNSNLENILNTNVIHIHGLVDDGMILGVNDLSQVSNTELHDNIDIEESIVKSKFNEACGEKFDLNFNNKIEKANIICAFGLSFGDSDKIWWEKIGERLRQGSILIIFDRKYDVSKLHKNKLARMRREIKNHFLTQTSLPEDVQNSIGDRIYVGVNTNMFQGITSKPEVIEFADKFGNAKIELANT